MQEQRRTDEPGQPKRLDQRLSNYLNIAYLATNVCLEQRAYNQNPNRLLPTTDGEAILIFIWRKALHLSRKNISASRLPDTLGTYKRLFRAYDGLVDSSASLPSLPEVKSDPTIKHAVNLMLGAVSNAPIPPDKAKLIIKTINRQKYHQYHLQERYGANPTLLSVNDALLWRQRSAGELTACFAEIANIQCGINQQEGNTIKNAFYWLGASLQLVDDVVDIYSDLSTNTQSSFRSCLVANGEADMAMTWFDEHKATIIPFPQLQQIAPRSLHAIRATRQLYFQQIPQTENYQWIRFVTDPSHFQPIYSMYAILSSPKTTKPL